MSQLPRSLERVTGGAKPEDRLPLIVALHGRGDAPENFAELFVGFREPARFVFPYGRRVGDGYQYYDASVLDEPAQLASAVASTEPWIVAEIEDLIRTRPTLGRPIVTGFSQGAVLCFALCARSPALIAAALPVAGLLPVDLAVVTGSAPLPPLVAFHGTMDTSVVLARGEASVARLKGHGYSASLRRYDGVAHTISEPERKDLFTELAGALKAERRRAMG